MARYPRRSIPPVLDDPRTAALTLGQQRTLLLLPLALDDHGRALDDVGTLNGLLWGPQWEQHPPTELDDDLDALAAERFVTRYEVEGVRYLQMLDWAEQQVISRPGRSRYPAPPAGTRSRPGPADNVWSTVEGLVTVVSGAAEKLHDPTMQAKGVRLLADLAGQIDPGLAGKVREQARTWVGTAADEPAPGDAASEAPPRHAPPPQAPPRQAPPRQAPPRQGPPADGDPWSEASDT